MTIPITEETLKRHRKKKGESDTQYRIRVSRMRASLKYNKKYIKQIKIPLNVKKDSDLIDFYHYIPKIYGMTRAGFFKEIMQQEYEKYEEQVKEFRKEEYLNGNRK